MMTLDEAIWHCNDKSDCTECGMEHKQLADWLKELRTFKDLEEQGLMLKLPCKLGDTVYATFGGKVSKQIVRGILLRDGHVLAQDGNGSNFGVFGKNVFLTKAEAWEALKGMEGENEAD